MYFGGIALEEFDFDTLFICSSKEGKGTKKKKKKKKKKGKMCMTYISSTFFYCIPQIQR